MLAPASEAPQSIKARPRHVTRNRAGRRLHRPTVSRNRARQAADCSAAAAWTHTSQSATWQPLASPNTCTEAQQGNAGAIEKCANVMRTPIHAERFPQHFSSSRLCAYQLNSTSSRLCVPGKDVVEHPRTFFFSRKDAPGVFLTVHLFMHRARFLALRSIAKPAPLSFSLPSKTWPSPKGSNGLVKGQQIFCLVPAASLHSCLPFTRRGIRKHANRKHCKNSVYLGDWHVNCFLLLTNLFSATKRPQSNPKPKNKHLPFGELCSTKCLN